MESKSILSTQWMEYCHVIYKDNKGLVVDPGFNVVGIAKELKALNLESVDILLTHCHFDHYVGVNDVLEMYPDANIYVHEASVPVFQHGNVWFEKQFGDPYIFNKTPIFYEPKMNIQGFELKVDWVPGHTIEHVLIHIVGEDSIIVGDTIFRTTIGRTDFFSANQMYLDETLKVFEAIDGNTTVYQGHDVPFKLQEAFDNNPFFTEWREQVTPVKETLNLDECEVDSNLDAKYKDHKDYESWLITQKLLMSIKSKVDLIPTEENGFYTSGWNWNKKIYQAFATEAWDELNDITKEEVNIYNYQVFMKYTLLAELRLINNKIKTDDIEKWFNIIKK